MLICGQGPTCLPGRPDFDHKHSSGRILAYGSTANFQFHDSIASLNISKESPCYGDRSSPRILQNGPVILKLS